jgi:Zn-dependent protease with chaperone function
MRVNGFYGHIQRNRLRSVVMFGGFLVAIEIIAAVVLTVPLFFLAPKYCPLLELTAYFSAFGLPVAGAGLVLFAGNYFWHLDNIQELSGFQKVTVHDEPRLWRIVEIQARLVGLPMPTVAVIPSHACNAFAAGLGRSSAVIVVTQGLLTGLDDEQLEAVIAHEMAHIVNGDTGAIAVANAMLSSLLMISRRNPLRLDKWYKLLLSVIFVPLFFIYLIGGLAAFVGATMAMFSRYIIASSREFIADAQAVEITKNPAALISALQVIQGRSAILGLDPQLDAMMIDGETMGAYASHPPMAERIAVLTQLAGSMASTVGRRKDTRPEALKPAFAGGAAAFSADPSVAQLRARFQYTSARSAPTERQMPKGIVARLNAGSERNAFGITPGIRTALKYVVIGCVAWMVYINMQLRSMMLPESLPTATKTVPAGQLAPVFPLISTEIKPSSSSTARARATEAR